VEIRPPGSCLFFVGFVKAINPDGTVDVVMEGEDPEDIEK
jgi:acylphosphatase